MEPLRVAVRGLPGALLVISLLTLAFWAARIHGTATVSHPVLFPQNSADIYMSYYPTAARAYGELRAGELPLWNPYQACGVPLLAFPLLGLFYPGNLPHLFWSSATAFEIVHVTHLIWGALGIWLLIRAFGMSSRAGLVAALTFTWSGWLVHYANQPMLVAAMCWLPMMLWLIERTLDGSRRAAAGLAVAVACQILNGATEYFVYNLGVAAVFTVVRLCVRLPADGWRGALVSGSWATAAVAVGALVSSLQLAPTMELIALGWRSGALTVQQALHDDVVPGRVAPALFASEAFSATGRVTVGVLPILALGLAVGVRRQRALWLFALVLVVTGALLVFGGWFFQLYYSSGLGAVFRRPIKFLHVYALGQALMAGLAVCQLEGWRRRPGSLAREPAWWAGLACGAAGITWLAIEGGTNALLVAALGALLVFGLGVGPTWRRALLALLLLIHGSSLFLGVGNTAKRPWAQPEVFDSFAPELDRLKRMAEDGRVYLSRRFNLHPGLTSKQGTLRGVRVTTDYDPIPTQRSLDFFLRASKQPYPGEFAMTFPLGPGSSWRLLDLTSTHLYVAKAHQDLARHLEDLSKTAGSGFRRVPGRWKRPLRVYERRRALPRSYFVSGARLFDDPKRVLDELDSDRMKPRTEVLLEPGPEPGFEPRPPNRGHFRRGRILRDETEHVRVEIDAPVAGFLVLTDSFYPGWKAHVDGAAAPIFRANYLFRAVPVEPGLHTVSFDYEPASFRRGALLSGLGTLVLVGGLVWARQQRAGPV